MLKYYTNEQCKMQNSSPDINPTISSIIYNDSGYFTNLNPDATSLSLNSNSDPSFELNEDISLHLRPETTVQPSNAIYFCENAVFDEPKHVEPSLLCDANNYEQFSSLIKFSLIDTCSNYLNNSNKDVLQYLDDESLSNVSSINPSQPNLVSEDRKNIITEAVEECLTNDPQYFLDLNSVKNNVKTPEKYLKDSVLSPELFSDTESENETNIIEIKPSICENIKQVNYLNDEFIKNDRKLVKRVQEYLSGVPPPPSSTIIQMSAAEMLEKINNNKHLLLTKDIERNVQKSLLISNDKNDLSKYKWPEIMNLRYHGLHYNRSTISEDFELSCSRYLSRYVGCETASSCTQWGPTAAQRKGQRAAAGSSVRWAPKSPGRRLAHLARRRITFSSANLQQNASMSVLGNNSHHNKLMIDIRKPTNKSRRSPWKNSPRKSPQKRITTPNSLRSKGFVRPDKITCTKRALFQSPDKNSTETSMKSRKSLFNSPAKKRKRTEDDSSQPNKLPRSQSLEIKSIIQEKSLQRRNSEIMGLSELHKQKMLWAVSESLRAYQITMNHPQFRHFAAILCKIIKNQVPDLMCNGGPRQPGSTSDRMLKIARKHVYDVTRGKTLADILQIIKTEEKQLKPPKGYVPLPEKYVLKDKKMNIQENGKLNSIKRQIFSER